MSGDGEPELSDEAGASVRGAAERELPRDLVDNPLPEAIEASEELGGVAAWGTPESDPVGPVDAPARSQAPPPVARPDARATLRKTLKGELGEFLEPEVFCPQTVAAITWLVVQLSRYQEEGVVLYPRVVVCADVNAVMARVSGGDLMPLGSGKRCNDTMQSALKKCAPLARDEWIAYVQLSGGVAGATPTFDYGVFRETGGPIGVSIRDTMVSGDMSAMDGGVVLISQVADRVVELVGARVNTLTYHLSAAEDKEPSPLEAIEELAEAITALFDEDYRENTKTFMSTTLVDALRKGHGALIAIAKPGAVPGELKLDGGVSLEGAPLDLGATVRTHLQEKTPATLSRAIAHAKLVEGMLATDGITVFESDAKVTRYNVFVKPPPEEGAGQGASGGARKRAFAFLKTLVERDALVAAFFRSADGGSLFYRKASDV